MYVVGGSSVLCVCFGTWNMLRLPVLGVLTSMLVVEFWVYWVVRAHFEGCYSLFYGVF